MQDYSKTIMGVLMACSTRAQMHPVGPKNEQSTASVPTTLRAPRCAAMHPAVPENVYAAGQIPPT